MGTHWQLEARGGGSGGAARRAGEVKMVHTPPIWARRGGENGMLLLDEYETSDLFAMVQIVAMFPRDML